MTTEENNTNTLTLTLGRTEALAYIRNARGLGRVIFGVRVNVWLPTKERRGFESGAHIFVSRKKALDIIKQAFSETFERRGAKIHLAIDWGRNDAKYITIGGVVADLDPRVLESIECSYSPNS